MNKIIRKIISLVVSVSMISNGFFVLAQDTENVSETATTPEIYEQKEYKILFDNPAENSMTGWKNSSMPIGNGYMGVSVFGDPASDRVQINEMSLWRVSSEGDFGCQESMADLYIDTDHSFDAVENYTRQVVMNNGVASMSYTYDGVDYKREYFASYPDKVTVVKLSANEDGKINFTLRPEISYEDAEAFDAKTGTVVAEGDTITLSGTESYFNNNFEAQFKIITDGGEVTASNETDENGVKDNGSITVTGADSAYVIIALGTNYVMESSTFTAPDREKLDPTVFPHEKVTGYINAAATKTYEELLSAHKADFESYFNRVVFDLGGVEDGRTTADLIVSYRSGVQEKYLEELTFQMGRYMLISSSRKGNLPAGLQSIWNAYGSPDTPWSGGFWYNVNQQMNYWPAFTTNLNEMYDAYLDYNLAKLDAAETNGSEYIQKYYPAKYEDLPGANGWLVGTSNSAYYVGTSNATGHSGPGTGGFTAISDIDYYRYTQDFETLKSTYTILESLARFHSKIVDDYDGVYLATLSASPEMKIDDKSYRTIGCAFDQQMIYEINKYVVDVYDEYKDVLDNPDTELIETIRGQLDKYDHAIVGYSGQIKEYREEDYYGEIGESNHRHISQLVGLYPGTSINEDTPAWLDAAKVTLEGRGVSSGKGWSLAHKLALWARAGEAETSYSLVKNLIARHSFDNLFNAHQDKPYEIMDEAVFQADANFGKTAGIAEMLLQSQGEYIKILPALPSAWAEGEYKGLVARGDFDVNVAWENSLPSKIEVKSNAGEALKLNYLNIANATVTDANGNAVSFTSKNKDRIEIATNIGDEIIITNVPAHTITLNVTDVAATANESGATVNWTASETEGATYNVYRAFESAPTYELLASGVSETTYEDAGRNGRQATYKITAVAENMEESVGETSTVIPDAEPVEEITAFMADDTHLQLEWTAPEKADGYKLYEKTEDGYTFISDTKYLVEIIPDADATKTYAISSTYYDSESEKTNITITEKGDKVSKVELYEYMANVNALSGKGYSDEDLATIADDIATVQSVWGDVSATAEDVANAVTLAEKVLENASYFTYNVLLNKPITYTGKVDGTYYIELLNDGDNSTRASTRQTTTLTFDIALGDLCDISDFELIDYRSTDGSRGDEVIIYGKLSNGKWIEMYKNSALADYPYSSAKRTITGKSTVSLPVSDIRLVMNNTDDYVGKQSIWEFKAVGSKHDTRAKILSVNVNPEKPEISGQKYEVAEDIQPGCLMHTDRSTFFAYHIGSAFKGLTQIKVPVMDSARTANDELAAFLKGDNTYLDFTANSDGKVYVNFSEKLVNYTEAKGWTLLSDSMPTLPDGYTWDTLPADYTFEDFPYYITRTQINATTGAISSTGARRYTYVKEFSAYETVEIPTVGTATKENLFIAVELNGENSNTELDYLFYNDRIVKMESGKYAYEFNVDSTSITDISGLAKSGDATVTLSSETADASSGKAIVTATVEANGKQSTYTFTFKTAGNVVLNKPITYTGNVDGTYYIELLNDGNYDTRASTRQTTTLTFDIDLQGTYSVSEFEMVDFVDTTGSRGDKLTLSGLDENGEWVELYVAEDLTIYPVSGSKRTITGTFDKKYTVSAIRVLSENTDDYNAKQSIWELVVKGIEVSSTTPDVVVYPENEDCDANALIDSNSGTFYETPALDFSAYNPYVIVKADGYKDIKRILVTPRNYEDGEEYYYDRPVAYTVYTSTDNVSFTQLTEGTIEYADFNDYDTKIIEFADVVNANYIKIEFTDVYGERGDGNKYLSLAEISFVQNTDVPSDTLDGMDFYHLRDGFANSFVKFNSKGTATVAFLGGSITSTAGYRVNIMNYLEERFPDTEFTFINAGIPSTDSTLGAFRLEKDILSKGEIDLLFVEFAVNDEDNSKNESSIIKGMEGIIRHAYNENPYTDICVMHFSDPKKHAQYSANENHDMPVITTQEKAVSHYNVTSLDLAKEVSARIENGELTWEEFGGKHPSAIGHKIYSDGVIAVLENSWEDVPTVKTKKTLPALYNENSYVTGEYVEVTEATLGEGFSYVENWAPTDGVATREGYVNVPMLESTTVGSSLTYTFTGTDLGILLPAGPDVGYIDYSVDGGEVKSQNLYTKWSASLHIPFAYMLATELDYGEHTVTITVSETKDADSLGNAVRIQNFLVNGDVEKLTVETPIERDLYQRDALNNATVEVSGSYYSETVDSVTVSAVRMEGYSAGEDVEETKATLVNGQYSASLNLKGGYYKIIVKAYKENELVESKEVNKVGVGEIFITAGQSNSASFSKDETMPADDRVVAYDYANEKWVLAEDPQVSLGEENEFTSWGNAEGETRSGGSVWPSLGDILTEKLDVPVGFMCIGIGSSRVKQWANELYPRMQKAVTKFGANGVRAVLWHQGENDSKNSTSTATYVNYLTTVINNSRTDAGWNIPWLVSIAAYNNVDTATEENQEAIREAQRQVIANTDNVFTGPYTDDMLDDYRDSSGVHFSEKGLKEFAARWATAIETAFFGEDAEYMYGDISEDGEINAADLLKLAKYIAGFKSTVTTYTSRDLAVSDVTRDGKVTSADLLKLVRYCAGLITEL